MGANYRGKCKKALKIKFRGFNFVTATSPGVWHCISDDDIRVHSHSRSSLFNTKPYLQRLGQIA